MDVAPGGLRYGLPPVVAGGVALLVSPGLAVALIAVGIAAIAFHRDPGRSPEGPGVVAPADGRVRTVRLEDGRLRVGVFMNVWDVHVNRAPLPGTVETIDREPGAHRPAFTKESDRNERVRIGLSTPAGPAEIVLIAGAFARRIHPYLEEGDRVGRGGRIGHISFGSRVDVRLPPGLDPDDLAVERGQRVRAGETVLVADAGGDSGPDRSGALKA